MNPAAQTSRNRKQKLKMKDTKKYKDLLHQLLDWLQEFREILVDESGL